MKRIPIKVAKDFVKKNGQRGAVIICWEHDKSLASSIRTHVITYGISLEECGWAASLGNNIKRKMLGWPEDLCNDVPRRLKNVKPQSK